MRESQLDSSNVTSTQSLRPSFEHEESRATVTPEDGFNPVLAQGGLDAAFHARVLNRITCGAPSRASHALLQMQRTYGNRYVQRVLEIARQREGDGESEVSPEVEASIERSRGGGQSLENGTRRQMESAFGVDFGSVRIHTGAESHSLNRAVSAVAFTTGSDIFFSDGAYDPGGSGGRELLAHELTHVVQQGGSRAAAQGKLVVGEANDPYEQEADQIAKSVVSTIGGSAATAESSTNAAASPVQRKCACGGNAEPEGECAECRAEHEAKMQAKASSDLSKELKRKISDNRLPRIQRKAACPTEVSAEKSMRPRLTIGTVEAHGSRAASMTQSNRGTTASRLQRSPLPGKDGRALTPSGESSLAKKDYGLPTLKCGPITCPTPESRGLLSPDPHITSGARCRGACGPDCPATCVGDYDMGICQTDSTGQCHAYCTYSAMICGTHAGCREHDSCYDKCAAWGETDPYSAKSSCHRLCDYECEQTYGVNKCISWARGHGPYDGHLKYFTYRSQGEPSPGACEPAAAH